MQRNIFTFILSGIIFLACVFNLYSINQSDSTKVMSWKEMMDSCNTYQKAQDFETALKWALQAEVKAKAEFGEMDTNYIATLGSISEIYYYLANFDSAIHYGELNLKLRRSLFKTDHPDLVKGINNMAAFYNGRGNYKEAEPLYKEALEMQRRIYKTDHPDLAASINNMAMFYNGRGNYKEAEPLLKEALEMRRRIFKGDHKDLAGGINNMATFYYQKGNYKKAEPLFIEALEMQRRIYKTDNPNLATFINNMAIFYNTIGKDKEAETLYIESLEMRRGIFKTDHPDLALGINNMAKFYYDRGNYKKAEPLMKEALEMRRRIFKTDHPDLAQSIMNMGGYYNGRGNYKEAEPLYKEALEMYRRIYKSDSPELASSINNMGLFYNELGNAKEAGQLLKEALEMRRRIYKDDHSDLARSIMNMGGYFNDIGNYKEAESLFKEALEMYRRIYKKDNQNIANSINNMATFYYGRGNYKEAEIYIKEALNMYRRIYNGDHPGLAGSINNMAAFYKVMGNFIEAEPLYKEALEMYRRIFNSDYPELAISINNMAAFYNDIGKYEEAEPLFIEGLKVNINILNNYFPSLSEKEKKQFWNTLNSNFERFHSFAIARKNNNSSILSNMYDIQLYSKALLYNSTSKIKNRIFNSNDSSLIDKLRELNDKREFLVKLYSITNEEIKKKRINIDSIENVANNLEKDISLKSEDFKQSYEKKNITWKSIQPFLKPDEAAIEVVRFRLWDKSRFTDTIYYAFLIVNDETIEHPDIIVLENGNELEGDAYNFYRKFISKKINDNASFGIYWGKVYDKLKKYKKIYLSADGIYNKLNLSTMMMPDGSYLFDVQEIQLLNSTKDLQLGYYKKQDESSVYNSAVLIGNPNFSLADALVKEASQKIIKEEGEKYYNENLAATRGITLTSLPGTEKEIKDIEKFLKGKKWIVKSYLGDMALKAAVKSANSPRVLHIATHGMFLEDVKSDNKMAFGFEEKKLVENPLLRSGLFFAGAGSQNPTPSLPTGEGESNNGLQPIATENNGLLTAYEAMNLSLDKTELVVLSACETGLGDVLNGEGVFGLRRAFQQAGAKTIIMSLWSVNDKTTQELMSTFYKEWLGGKTKREAFKTAQMKLKEKYTYPYFWGAFVMVGE